MKIFQKLKKWLAGFLAIQLLAVSLGMPFTVSATDTVATTVTVDAKITDDDTPALTGLITSQTETILVYFNSRTDVSYEAQNNGDGTWILPDNTVSHLANAVHDVIVVTSSGAQDETTDELIVDHQSPSASIVAPSESGYLRGVIDVEVETWDLTPTRTQLEVTYGLETDILYDVIDEKIYESETLIEWDTTIYQDGEYSLRLTAYDHFGRFQQSVVNVTIDNTAPVVKTSQEFASLQPNVLGEVGTKNLDDSGVYIAEENNDVTVKTEWKVVAPITEGSARTYEVVYHVTDLAGNTTSSTPVTVELTEDEVEEAEGDLPVVLLGDDVLDHERGTVYLDAGAQITGWESDYVHAWTFGNLDTAKSGEYTLGYNAEEGAELLPTEVETTMVPELAVRNIKVVDTFGPQAVTGLKATPGNGYVQLTWVNPIDDDLAGLDIYRSTVQGQLGTKVVAALSSETDSFDDYTVVNGVSYYYTVVTFDADANSKVSAQVAATPMAPKVVATTSDYYNDGAQDMVAEPEVKSDETQDRVEVEEESSFPVIGIIILVLLIVLGIYLLYLQNPKWFDWALFWKRKTVKAKIKKR